MHVNTRLGTHRSNGVGSVEQARSTGASSKLAPLSHSLTPKSLVMKAGFFLPYTYL